jgi:hypothetical protein
MSNIQYLISIYYNFEPTGLAVTRTVPEQTKLPTPALGLLSFNKGWEPLFKVVHSLTKSFIQKIPIF